MADDFPPPDLISSGPPPDLVMPSSVMQNVESGPLGDAAVSPTGAIGRDQVMPATARDPGFGVAPAAAATPEAFDVTGDAYWQAMQRHFGNPYLASAAYNAGPTMVEDWLDGTNRSGKNPNLITVPDPRRANPSAFVSAIPFPETRNYVQKISNQQGFTGQPLAASAGPPADLQMPPSDLTMPAAPQSTAGAPPADLQMPPADLVHAQAEAREMPGKLFTNPKLAPTVPQGAPRPLAPGEYVKNPNGSWSSELTVTVQDPGLNKNHPTVVPSLWVVDGKPVQVSEDQAIQYAKESGLHWPSYKTIDQANTFADAREKLWQQTKPQDASAVSSLWEVGASQRTSKDFEQASGQGNVSRETTSAPGTFLHGVERGVIPAAGGMAGFGAGAQLGAEAGALVPGFEEFTVPGGALIGGIAGAFGLGSATARAQQWLIRQLPQSIQEAIGQDQARQIKEETQHPYAAMTGELLPNLAMMRPGPIVRDIPEGASAVQKLMASPVTARAVPAAIMGTQEAVQEKLAGEDLDPTKIAIAGGAGALMNRETGLGRTLTMAGAVPVRAAAEAMGASRTFRPGTAPPEEGQGGPGGLEPPTFEGTASEGPQRPKGGGGGQAAPSGMVVGLRTPGAPPQRATVVGTFDDGRYTTVRHEDGTYRDMFTTDLLRDMTEPPPREPTEPNMVPEAPKGGEPVGPREPEPFDFGAEPVPRRPPSTATLGAEALRALDQADLLERAALSDSGIPNETRQQLLSEAAMLRSRYSHEPDTAQESGYRHGLSGEPSQDLGELAAARAANPERYEGPFTRPAQPGMSPEVAAALNDVRLVRGPMERSPRLIDTIIAMGGIRTRDASNNLTPDGQNVQEALKDYRRPGLINNRAGMLPDYARQALKERGWFGHRPEDGEYIDDFTELLRKDAQSEPVYHPDSSAYEQIQQRRQIESDLSGAGIPESDDSMTAARKLAAWRQSEARLMELRAVEQDIDRDLDGLTPAAYKDLEGEGYEPGSDIGAEFEAPERLEERPQAAEPQPPGPPHPEEGTGPPGTGISPPSGRLPEEQAEPGRPYQQVLVPGTERSAVQAAKAREAEGRGAIKPPAAQAAPGELFAAAEKREAERAQPRLEEAQRQVEPVPSEAQIKAGNYQKGHVSIQGLPVTIETPAGGMRRGRGPGGPWEVRLQHPYGYVKGTKGADNEQIDVYVGPHPESPDVFVVDQIDPKTGKFDEHKAIIGARTDQEAAAIYDAGFSDGSGPSRRGAITPMAVDQFKAWLDSGKTKQPLAPEAERAPEPEAPVGRPLDDNKNPIFKKGERVVIPATAGDEFGGRHGVVTNQTGITMQELFGGKRSTSYHYDVKTDGGATTYASRLEPETSAAPKVPADPAFEGHHITPAALRRRIEIEKGNIRRFQDKKAAARKPENKRAWESRVTKAADSADAAFKVLKAWEKANPGHAPAEIQQPVHIPQPPRETGVTVRENQARDGVEVKFPSKPSDEVIGRMRAAGFRWSRGAKLWYARRSPRTLEFANSLNGEPSLAPGIGRAPGEKGWIEIGKNIVGQTLYEDERGVRSYIENGVRRSEPVGLHPSPTGMRISTDREGNSEFKLLSEVTPTTAATMRAEQEGGIGELDNAVYQPAAMPITSAAPPSPPARGTPVFVPGDKVEIAPQAIPTRPDGGAGRSVVDVTEDGKSITLDGGAQVGPEDLLSTSEVTKLPSEGGPRGLQVPISPRHGGPGPENVHGAAPVRQAGRTPSGEEPRSARTPAPVAGIRAERPGRQPQGYPGEEVGGGEGAGPDVGLSAAGEPAAQGTTRRPPQIRGRDLSINPGETEEGRGPRAKALGNLAAIELAKRLIAVQRVPTREEQLTLAKYVGWGGLSGAFPDASGKMRTGFEDVGKALKELLTPEEYETARRSTQYAHYTAESVIRSMWGAVEQMGFRGGNIFEPGMGVGHFLGMAPPDVALESAYQGLEMDHLTADIAKLLYPESGVKQGDYTRTPMPDGTFDLVIGNPPFSDTVIKADPRYAPLNLMLHDYFFVKSLDTLRPGGILAFITSAGTMNKGNTAARAEMAKRAEFLGGVRLPSDAFKRNAGTEVTTDILFFQKRPEPVEDIGAQPWLDTVTRQLPDDSGAAGPVAVNRYFSEHPELVLGEEGRFDKLYKGRYAVHAKPGMDFDNALREALSRLPQDIYRPAVHDTNASARLDFEAPEHKDGSFYLQNGRLMQYESGVGKPVPRRGAGTGGITNAEHERITALVPLRDALRDVYKADLEEDGQAGAEARERLNRFYDAFVGKFGPINKAEYQYRRPNIVQQENARAEARELAREIGAPWNEGDFDSRPLIAKGAKTQEIARARDDARQRIGKNFDEGSFNPADMEDIIIEKRPNIDPFTDDPESYRMRAIEEYNDASGEHSKRRIFFESVLTREQEPKLESANDGVLWSLNQLGRLDLPKIAEKMGRDVPSLVNELGDSIFRVPATRDTYQTADEYLSGDVKDKLAEAVAAAESDPDMRRNASALQSVQPAPLAPSEITMSLGMPWIPEETIEDFANNGIELGDVRVARSDVLGSWQVGKPRNTGREYAGWGTDDITPHKILEGALNRQAPRVYRDVYVDGKKTREFDPVATQSAQDKITAMRKAFETWLASDEGRTNQLADLYNDRHNRIVPRKYDGGYLTTPGVSSDWHWRPHQRRVVARIVQDGNTYIAHTVGAGKTSAYIGAGMEMRRLGLVNKPMYIVPNHMLGQFTKEFYEQYPTAKVMVADERRFHTARRKQFIADAAQQDLDGIIITHSAFKMIPISQKFEKQIIREELDRISEAMQSLQKGGEADRFTIKRLENQKEKLEQRMLGATRGRKDQTFTFEEMGVDHLFVDEAHEFRKLNFATRQSSLKGIDPDGSDKAWDLLTKVRYLDSKRPGRSVVMGSGTPVTNTMGELFTLSRYMQPQELEKRRLSHFDSWASTFGEPKTEMEQTPSGTYEPATRFASFVNAYDLYRMVSQIMDVVTPAQLDQYVVRPKLVGGKRQFHLAPRTPFLDDYQAELGRRVEAIKRRKGPPSKGDDILLSVINDGRYAALDPRFVAGANHPATDSKLTEMVNNAFQIWKKTKNVPFYDPASSYTQKIGEGPATQMIFANFGINKSEKRDFSGYDWMKRELVRRGVPANEIAFIKDFDSHVARQRLFNDMNEGKVRILIGSTQKMGTGVNAQRRLYALHNQDPLWFPADDEQRVGRILRQGNLNPQVEVHDYSTKGTYDSNMWQMMGRKARFIEQFFRGDPELRTMEDIGEASQYEQASAMATMDERVIKLTELRQELERIDRQRQAHDREQYAMRRRLADNLDYIASMEAGLPKIEQDIARRDLVPAGVFTATVGGKKFDKSSEAATAIHDAIIKALPDLEAKKPTRIAEIVGFPINGYMSQIDKEPYYTMGHSGGEWALRGTTGNGIIRSALNRLEALEGDREYNLKKKAETERLVQSLRGQIGKQFDPGVDLAKLRGEANDLETQIAASAKKPVAEEGAAPYPMVTEQGALYGEGPHQFMATRPGMPHDLTFPVRELVGTIEKRQGPNGFYDAIRNYLLTRGQQTGQESMILQDTRVGDVRHASTDGLPDACGATSATAVNLISDGGESLVMHHNHPASRSLSAIDVAALANPGLRAIVAHGHDGYWHGAALTPATARHMRSQPLLGAQIKMTAIADAANDAATSVLRPMVAKGEIGRETANAYHALWVNQAMDKAGVIDFATDKETRPSLTQTAAKVIAKASRAAAAQAEELGVDRDRERLPIPYRPAGPVRYQEGMASLSEQLRQAPGYPARSAVGAPEGGAGIGGAGPPGLLAEPGAPYDADQPPQTGPEGKDYIDNVAVELGSALGGQGAGTYARTLARGFEPTNKLPIKMLDGKAGVVERQYIMPRTLASTDWRSARYWEAWRNRDDRAGELLHQAAIDSQGYVNLSRAQRDQLHAAEELTRLKHLTLNDDGRRVVLRNDIGITRADLTAMPKDAITGRLQETGMSGEDARNAAKLIKDGYESTILAALDRLNPPLAHSKTGDVVALDPATTKVYFQRRAMFQRVWGDLMRGAARKFGWMGEPDAEAIRAEAERAPAKSVKNSLLRLAGLMDAMAEQEKTGYVPFMRQGDYYLAVKPKYGTDRSATGGFPRVVDFQLVDSKPAFSELRKNWTTRYEGDVPQAAQDAIKKLRQRYPEGSYDIEHGYIARKPERLRDLDIPAIEKLLTILGQRDTEVFAPMAEELLNKLFEEMRAGFRKRAQDVPGYDSDFGRTTGAYLHWTSQHIADLEHKDAITKARQDYIETHPSKGTRQWWKDWDAYQERPSEKMRALSRFGFYWELAANPSSTAAIALHAPMVATFSLGAGLGKGVGGSVVAGKVLYPTMEKVMEAIRADGKQGLNIDIKDIKGLTPEERKALEAADRTGLFHSAAAEDLAGLQQQATDRLEALDGVRDGWNRLLRISGSNISVVDRMNRIGTYLAALRLAKKPGTIAAWTKAYGGSQVLQQMIAKHGDGPLTWARFMTDESVFVWGKRNRPQMARGGLGASLFTFRQFEMNYISKLWQLGTRTGAPGRHMALQMLVGLAALAGVAGLPFVGDVIDLIEGIGALFRKHPMIEAHLRKWMEDVGFSKLGAEAVLHGPAAAYLGTDLSNRLGFGDIFSRNLGNPVAMLGAVPGILYNSVTGAVKRLEANQPLGAAGQLMPAALRNVWTAFVTWPHEGVRTATQSPRQPPVVSPRDITPGMQIEKAAGFAPSAVSRAYNSRLFYEQLADQARTSSTHPYRRVGSPRERLPARARGTFNPFP